MYKYFEATTSDKNILKKEILRQLIEVRAEELMVGKELVPVETMDALELKMTLPKVTRFDPEEIAEGAAAGYQMFEWFDTTQVMKKEQTRIKVTDEAKARMQADIQTRKSIEAAARGLAWSRDTDIFSTLATGYVSSNAAEAYWTADDCNIANDVAKGIDTILTGTYLTDIDLQNMKLAVPIGLWGYMNKPVTLGTMDKVFWSDYIQQKYKINIVYTRQLTTSAFIVINSPETASHIVYGGSAVPTSETGRIIGVGDEYVFTHYFKTFIMPEAENGTTNHRIYRITGVKS
jgi:hypothetical protein